MIQKVALVITTYNRPELLKQCLDSLMRADLSGLSFVLIGDDDSTDLRVLQHVMHFQDKRDLSLQNGDCKSIHGLNVFLSASPQNVGIKSMIKTGCEQAILLGCTHIINLDPDTLVTPDFIPRLLELKKRFPEHIVTGFNSASPRHPILRHANDYLIKKTVGGINLCFDKQQYETIIKPALLQDKTDWDYAMSAKCTNGIVVAKPSVVQHIGMTSTMGHDYDQDIATDFPGFIPTPTKKPMPRFPRNNVMGNKI